MIPEFNGDFVQWLRGFYYTATSGSMTAATEKMNRNQSAMTHQIRSIEKEFNVKLFTGTKANRVLTEEGKYLLTKTIHIFNIINEIKSHISDLPSDIQGEISITAMYSAFNYFLPGAIGQFSSFYPDVQFSVSGEIYQGDLYEKVHNGTCDLGIVSADDIPAEFETFALFSCDVALIVPLDYSITPGVTLEEIAQMPIIAPPKNSTLWQFLTRNFQRYGLKLGYKHIVDHQEGIKEYVAQGIGVSMLDRFACVGGIMDQMKMFSLSNFMPRRQYYLIRKRESGFMYPHIRALVDFLVGGKDSSNPKSVDLSFLECGFPNKEAV